MPVIPFITKENTRELAAKALEARKNNREAVEQRTQLLDALITRYATEQELQKLTPEENYRCQRLNRVRKQCDLIDQRIHEQLDKRIPDGQTLNWLCAAQARLAEQERLLAGRPAPGSLKPTSKSPRQVDAEPIPEPIHAQPTPQAVVSPVAKIDTTSGPLFYDDPRRA